MSNNSGSGCLGQLLAMVLLVGGVGLYELYEQTEGKMMREARKHSSVSYYASYLNKHPNGRYVSEAEDSVYSLCAKKGDFQDYVEIFPSGKHIAELEKDAQKAYNEALSAHSIEKWRKFKEDYPTAFHDDADAQIE